eukprot:TRINITY_DN16187_c0_g1_i1.p1 TRINITY_DN16187_c0_g1~~TRINITY_DN16187_c0_g1_i1.p1  ORF type:complete len:1299 (+),score=459.85 TRINITY_DN16187_c0_g1_i1:110-4006(+)
MDRVAMSVDAYYAGKSVLVTGAGGAVASVLVRELLRNAYDRVKRVYLLVDPADYGPVDEVDIPGPPAPTAPAAAAPEAADAEGTQAPQNFVEVQPPSPASDRPAPTPATPTPSEALKQYANHAAFGCLHDGTADGRAWFLDYLAQKVVLVPGAAAAGAGLGMCERVAAFLQEEVDVLFFGEGLVDPCDVDVDPDALHRAGLSVGGFAAKCRPDTVLVLPASLFAAAVGRRFRSSPLEFYSTTNRVPETPAVGIRGANAEADAASMPTPVVAASAAVESTLSNLAVQGGTACLAVVRHGLIGPPLLAPTPQRIIGGLDALAFGVQVGAVTRVRAAKTSLLEVVPADVLADRLLAAPLRIPAGAVGERRVVVGHAATTSVHPLAAKRAGGYFSEYYTRNSKALAASLDFGTPAHGGSEVPIRVALSPLLSPTPHLTVGRAWDADGVANLPKLAVLKANQKLLGRGESHLAKHPHAVSANRYRASLRRAVDMVRLLEHCLDAAGDAVFDTSALDGTTAPLPFIDPRQIEWETYCKTVSQICFAHLCRCLGIAPPTLPPPVKYCDMDALTAQPGMQFSRPLSLLQVFFPDLHFLVHSTQQPGGGSVQYSPGLTPLRRAEVLDHPAVARVIDQQAKKENVDREAIVVRANAILNRIGDKLNVKTLRVLGLALRKVMQIIYDHVHVNVDGYELVRRAIQGIGSMNPTGKRAVVLIPSHRSYMDFLVVSYLNYMWGLPVPHICAGEDFLRLAAVSKLLRGSGAFFMRRSFKGDPLYGALFREYARRMATDGRCIEFFIEGTRARSGKTMGPKVGILKIMVEALLDGLQDGSSDLSDVVFVPISLSYDKLLEGNIYVRELFGGKKPPETVRNLLGAASVLRSKFGCLNVTVGSPISLLEYIVKGDRGEPSPPPKLPRPVALLQDTPASDDAPEDPEALQAEVRRLDAPRKREILNTLAWRITANLQAGLVVTPTALVSAVLLYMHLPSELEEGVKLDQMANEVVWLREQVLQAGAQMKKDVISASGEDLVHYAAGLTGGRVVLSDLGSVAVPEEDSLLLLWVYGNQLAHLFCDRGVLAVAALSLAGEERTVTRRDLQDKTETLVTMHRVPTQALVERTKLVKDLLSIEFPNYRPASPLPHEAWFQQTLAAAMNDGVEQDGPSIDVPKNAPTIQFACSLLHPLLECYYLVAAGLTALRDGQKYRQPHLVERLGSGVSGLVADDVLQYSIAGNREVLRNAVARCREQGLVQVDGASQALTLPAVAAADDAAALRASVAVINSLRWKPAKDLGASVAAVTASLGAPAKL